MTVRARKDSLIKVIKEPLKKAYNFNRTAIADQQLQLKSQVLAYRMLQRKEKLPQVVRIAASNQSLKNINLAKNEMRRLNNFFRQEYLS